MLRRILLLAALAAALLSPAARLAAQEDHPRPAGEKSAVAESNKGEKAEAAEKQPNLLPDPTSRQTVLSALWVIFIFLVLLAVLYPTAWKNVLAGLKKREQGIRDDIANAEATRAKAEATLRQYNQQLADAETRVRDMLSKATTDAEQIANGIRTRAQQDAETSREKAEQDIERAKNDALSQIYEQTAVLATSVAEKILRRNLNPDDQRDLVARSLEQLQSIRGNGNN